MKERNSDSKQIFGETLPEAQRTGNKQEQSRERHGQDPTTETACGAAAVASWTLAHLDSRLFINPFSKLMASWSLGLSSREDTVLLGSNS